MRRRDLSHEELDRVIRLRQGRTSWLGIQNETGIPRRLAKRVYEKWERTQSLQELKEARKAVAAEEFRGHLQCLIKLAQSLVNTLRVPEPLRHPTTAKEFLFNLWGADIVGEFGAYGLPGVNLKPWSYLRQNQKVFESLKAHTREKDWEALEQWEKAWDTCNRVFAVLREEATQMLLNILKQKRIPAETIVKESGKEDAVERMIDGVLHVMWENILAGKRDPVPSIQGKARVDGKTEVLFGEHQLSLYLIFAEENLGKQVVDTCIWVAKNLNIERKEDMGRLVKLVKSMREAIDKLTETLNPLVLRPLILRSQCDLCPA